MAWKAGETVIVKQDGVNRVGVILDKFQVSKQTMYDILLENRSAITMVNSSPNYKTYQLDDRSIQPFLIQKYLALEMEEVQILP